MTDTSDTIVSGKVTRSWAAWDAGHRYIWTHYEVAVDAAHKGTDSSSLEIAEPGGMVGGEGMAIAGAVRYSVGENVVIFAKRMPNGYLRTVGWGQGKYGLDETGTLHADLALRAVDLVESKSGAQAASLRSLDGMNIRELSGRIAARVQAIQQRGGR